MSVKFGSKPIELEKGKAGIVVGSKEKLPAVIDTLIAAVRAGELDDIFSRREDWSGREAPEGSLMIGPDGGKSEYLPSSPPRPRTDDETSAGVQRVP